jgi:hypothetical protein
MDIFRRIIRDQGVLLERCPAAAFIPPTSVLPADYSKRGCKVKGYVPDDVRATFHLIGQYEREFKKAKTEVKRVEFVALKAAAEYIWETRLAECCRRFRLRNGQGVEVLGDWSIAVITTEC